MRSYKRMREGENMNIRVFDNKGKTVDQYTVIIDDEVYGMSKNPNGYMGVNYFSDVVGRLPAVLDVLSGEKNEDIGEEVRLIDLEKDLQRAIGKRAEVKVE